jgi:sensor histidine kinase regulating citrate/malate metabolism
MTEFTEEQELEIQKRITEAKQQQAILEQWTIAEDTLRRLLIATVEQQIVNGLLHPFHRKVAETMYSINITGRNFTQQPPEHKDEAPKQD